KKAAAVVVIADTDVRPSTASWGNADEPIATVMRLTSINPSNTRSTPTDARAVEKRTGSCRDATYARANSPARTGRRLFAMKPIAVACHSGRSGYAPPPRSRRMSCQRSVRIGNVRVASATVASTSPPFARRTPATRSRALTPCSAQASSPSVIPSPTTHAHREAAARSGASGTGTGLEGEGNEVADFFDEGAEGVAGCLFRRGAQLLRPRERAVSAVQQRTDVHHGRLAGRGGRAGRRCRVGRRGRSWTGEQLVQ